MKTIHILFTLFFFTSFGSLSQSEPLYAVSPYEDSIWILDTTTMMPISSVQLTSTLGAVNGSTGLAVRPCSGDVYIVMKITGVTGRVLGIVDPMTGIVADIGNMGENVAAICFGDADHLYAVTGDGATTSETLFKVDISTGAMTLFTAYGNGNDGENIGFCDDNGKIYHWSGLGTQVMEVTDTLSGATINIPRTGFDYGEVQGSVYIGNGEFIITTQSDEIAVVDTTGFAVNTGLTSGANYYKGLGFPYTGATINPVLTTTGSSTFCPGDSVTYDVTMASSYQWFLNGSPIAGGTLQSQTVGQTGLLNAEVMNSSGCVFYSDTVSLSFYNVPNVSISPGDTSICVGDTLLLIGASGGTLQWFMDGTAIPGANSSTLLVSSAGLYNMTKINLNGCSGTDPVGTTVIVNNLPPVSLTPSVDTSYCIGDSILLTGSFGGQSQWFMNGVAISGANSNTYYVTSPGYYNMQKTNSNGCSDSSAVGVNIVEELCDAGIAELIVGNQVTLYPSPVKEQLTISFNAFHSEKVRIELYTASGQLIQNSNYTTVGGANDIEVNTQALPKGVYVIRLIGSHGSLAEKFIK